MEETKKIKVPDGVDVTVDNFKVSVKGPKGEVERDFFDPKYSKKVSINKDKEGVKLSVKSKKSRLKSIANSIASHIENMTEGVQEGFTYKLKVVYAHFPISVSVEGDKVVVKNFLGGKKDRQSRIIGDTKVQVNGQDITVTGIDKEAVSQTAANIENVTQIPGKDRRVFVDGIFITSKGDSDEEEMEETQGQPEQGEKKEEGKAQGSDQR